MLSRKILILLSLFIVNFLRQEDQTCHFFNSKILIILDGICLGNWIEKKIYFSILISSILIFIFFKEDILSFLSCLKLIFLIIKLMFKNSCEPKHY